MLRGDPVEMKPPERRCQCRPRVGERNGIRTSTGPPPDNAAGRGSGLRGRQSRSGGDDYEDQGYDQAPPPPPPESPSAPAETGSAFDYDELERLGELHADGTLTDEEFAAAKAKILGT